MAVTNVITVPKDLYNKNNITKDNKSHWEAASRKMRALVPVMIQLNNKKVMEKAHREEKQRRKSFRSVKTKSSKSNDDVASVKNLSPDRLGRRPTKLISNPVGKRRSSLFSFLPGFGRSPEVSKPLSPKKMDTISSNSRSLKKKMTMKSLRKQSKRSVSQFQSSKRHESSSSESSSSLENTPKIEISPPTTVKQKSKEVEEFHEDADQEESESATDYNESSVFNTSEIEEEIVHQGALSVVSQYGINRSKHIIEPDSNYKLTWDVLNFCLIIYQSIVVPYRVCFDVPATGGMFYVELFMDFVFWTDIVLSFNSGYYDKGIAILDRKKIILKYLTGWFPIDFLASFPYNYTLELLITDDPNSSVESLTIAPRLLRMLKIVKFLRILKLLRVLKLKKVLYKMEEYIVTDFLNLIMDSTKLISVLLLLSHMIACTFYFVGTYEGEYNPDNWINNVGIQHEDKFDQYLDSFYFAFSTMAGVGYGDIRPFTNLERIFCMGCMAISTGVSAYLIGAISTLFNRTSMMTKEMKLTSLHINQFLMHHNIPNQLRASILSYLDYLIEHKKKNKLSENQVLELLNVSLREQVIANLNGRVLNECQVFDQFDMMFISEVAFTLDRKLYVMNDTVFEEGDDGNKMYFIAKGTVVLLHIQTHTYIKQLGENSSFGTAAFFSKHPRNCTVRTNNFTEILTLDIVSFNQILSNHKEDEELYNSIYEKVNEEKDYSELRILCYICKELGHMATECTEFWKIKGNILNKSHIHQEEVQQDEEPNLGYIRRLSRRFSRRSFLMTEDFNSSLQKHVRNSMKAPTPSPIRRASYMPPERVIVEETEHSGSSSTLKSKPPTSNTSSDDESSYNIHGKSSESSQAPHRNFMSPPDIQVKHFSSRSIKKVESSSKKSSQKSSKKEAQSSISSKESSSSSKSSSESDESSPSVSDSQNNQPRKTIIDPNIIAMLDPRLVSPEYASQARASAASSSSKSRSSPGLPTEKRNL